MEWEAPTPCRVREIRHAADANGRGARAIDRSSHAGEQAGKIHDLGFARRVVDDGFAGGEHGGHQDVLSTGDGDAVEIDFGAAKSMGRASLDVAVFLAKFGAEMLERGNVQVDGPRSDGATARKRNAGDAAAGNQGAKHETGSSRIVFDQIVGALRDGRGRELEW